MAKTDGVNRSSNSETKEEKIGSQAKYLGIKDNREPASGHLDHANHREGGPMSRAVEMVSRHNERGEHSPTVCGHKMHDGGMRHEMDHGTEGE